MIAQVVAFTIAASWSPAFHRPGRRATTAPVSYALRPCGSLTSGRSRNHRGKGTPVDSVQSFLPFTPSL